MSNTTDALVTAMNDYKAAYKDFDYVSDPKLIDAVIYRIKDAQSRISVEIERLRGL
jgi:hypothetical protein